jgi:hypothetical protein
VSKRPRNRAVKEQKRLMKVQKRSIDTRIPAHEAEVRRRVKRDLK